MAEFPAFYFHPVHARAGYLFNTQAELDSAGEGCESRSNFSFGSRSKADE